MFRKNIFIYVLNSEGSKHVWMWITFFSFLALLFSSTLQTGLLKALHPSLLPELNGFFISLKSSTSPFANNIFNVLEGEMPHSLIIRTVKAPQVIFVLHFSWPQMHSDAPWVVRVSFGHPFWVDFERKGKKAIYIILWLTGHERVTTIYLYISLARTCRDICGSKHTLNKWHIPF